MPGIMKVLVGALLSLALASVSSACSRSCDPADRYYEVSDPGPGTSTSYPYITADSYARCASDDDCTPLCREVVGSNAVLHCTRVPPDGGPDVTSRLGLRIEVQFHCS
jgi:hypothetical protein